MTKFLAQDFIRKNLYHRTAISFLLWPLSQIFSGIQRSRRALFSLFNKPYRSRCYVICVGNIVSGGSGKTPLTILLASFLEKSGIKVAISHRGYKGNFESSGKLISNYDRVFPSCRKAGDEACLLATRLPGIPVIVGKNRSESLKSLETEFSDLEAIILDDSFQHLKVEHDLDLLVFNSLGGIGNGFVLPAGILRESISSCRFADFLVVNGKPGSLPVLEGLNRPIIYGSYRIKGIYDITGREIEQRKLVGKRNVLLSGIGFPDSFENLTRQKGVQNYHHFRFPDHFSYDNKTINRIKNYVRENGIDYVLTTEKDFTKLKDLDTGKLPLLIVKIEFLLENGSLKDLLSSLFDKLKKI